MMKNYIAWFECALNELICLISDEVKEVNTTSEGRDGVCVCM